MSNYSIFSVMGIEIEYMLVDNIHFNVQPKADLLLQALAGNRGTEIPSEVSLGPITASNELVLHVIELKNTSPASPHAPIALAFQSAIERLQPLLNQHGLLLLPTGAHPWMQPEKETVCWPHTNKQIYQQYDEIFNCSGHGWSNLQSMHVNLPFANDAEFSQLHNAIRLILPLLPALAASSPFLEAKETGFKSTRLYFYEKNQERIPLVSGNIIPEFIHSQADYQHHILLPMYQAIRPFDPENLLQYEWLNSRAAIPKFASQSIEIRILDTQECIQADIAIAKVIFALLKHWQNNSHYYLENPYDTKRLKMIYDRTIREGLSTPIEDSELLTQWQLPRGAKTCSQIWSQLIEQVSTHLDKETQQALEHILTYGNLSERLLNKIDKNQCNKASLRPIYQELSHCLLSNTLF